MTELTKDMLEKAMDKFANNEVPEDAKVSELEQELKIPSALKDFWAELCELHRVAENSYDDGDWFWEGRIDDIKDSFECAIKKLEDPWRTDFENMPFNERLFVELAAGGKFAEGIRKEKTTICEGLFVNGKFTRFYNLKRYMLIPE